MAGKNELALTYIMNQLGEVLDKVSTTQEMTWDELREVAGHWCRRDFDYCREQADKLKVTYIALVHTALLFVEHPLLVGEKGWVFGPMRARAEILHVELWEMPVEQVEVIHKVIHSPCGENGKPADKSELSTASPQEKQGFSTFSTKEAILSTSACG